MAGADVDGAGVHSLVEFAARNATFDFNAVTIKDLRAAVRNIDVVGNGVISAAARVLRMFLFRRRWRKQGWQVGWRWRRRLGTDEVGVDASDRLPKAGHSFPQVKDRRRHLLGGHGDGDGRQ